MALIQKMKVTSDCARKTANIILIKNSIFIINYRFNSDSLASKKLIENMEHKTFNLSFPSTQ